MSKPEWKDAPEWATWLAQDGDGRWHWFEVEPLPVRLQEWDSQGKKSNPVLDRGPKEPRPKPKPKREPEEWFLVAGESLGVPAGTIAVISTTTSVTGQPCARVRFERYTH